MESFLRKTHATIASYSSFHSNRIRAGGINCKCDAASYICGLPTFSDVFDTMCSVAFQAAHLQCMDRTSCVSKTLPSICPQELSLSHLCIQSSPCLPVSNIVHLHNRNLPAFETIQTDESPSKSPGSYIDNRTVRAQSLSKEKKCHGRQLNDSNFLVSL